MVSVEMHFGYAKMSFGDIGVTLGDFRLYRGWVYSTQGDLNFAAYPSTLMCFW